MEEIPKETEEAEDKKEAAEEVLEADTEAVDEAVEEMIKTDTEVVTLDEVEEEEEEDDGAALESRTKMAAPVVVDIQDLVQESAPIFG